MASAAFTSVRDLASVRITGSWMKKMKPYWRTWFVASSGYVERKALTSPASRRMRAASLNEDGIQRTFRGPAMRRIARAPVNEVVEGERAVEVQVHRSDEGAQQEKDLEEAPTDRGWFRVSRSRCQTLGSSAVGQEAASSRRLRSRRLDLRELSDPRVGPAEHELPVCPSRSEGLPVCQRARDPEQPQDPEDGSEARVDSDVRTDEHRSSIGPPQHLEGVRRGVVREEAQEGGVGDLPIGDQSASLADPPSDLILVPRCRCVRRRMCATSRCASPRS